MLRVLSALLRGEVVDYTFMVERMRTLERERLAELKFATGVGEKGPSRRRSPPG